MQSGTARRQKSSGRSIIRSSPAEVKNFARTKWRKAGAAVPRRGSPRLKEQLAACRQLPRKVQRDRCYGRAARADEEFQSGHRQAQARWNVAQSALTDAQIGRCADGSAAMDRIAGQRTLDSVRSAMNEEMRSPIPKRRSWRPRQLAAITHNPTEPVVIEAHATVKEGRSDEIPDRRRHPVSSRCQCRVPS